MSWMAVGALVFVSAALLFVTHCVTYRAGGRDMRERLRNEQAERRSLRRIEARKATLGRHQLSPWPGPDPADQLATTDQLRKLAETGDIAEIRRQNAAFGRLHAFKQWIGAA